MADVWNKVADNLNRLNTITQQLTRLDKDLGSGEEDNSQLRNDMKRLRDEGQDIIKKTKPLLTQPYDRSQRAKHDKLQNQLTELSTQFEKAAKVTINKEMEKRLSLITPSGSNKNPFDSSSSGGQRQQQQQQQTQIQQQVNVDKLLLDERNKEIKELEKELTELSEVFVDVMTLTKEQGEDLHVVSGNATGASQQVEAGIPELKQANKYACQYRTRMLILAIIIMVVIAIIIIIAVVVSQNNKKNQSS